MKVVRDSNAGSRLLILDADLEASLSESDGLDDRDMDTRVTGVV